MLSHGNGLEKAFLVTAIVGLSLSPTGLAADATVGFALVPEMEEPGELLIQSERVRLTLQESAEALRGLDVLRTRVADLWPQIREVDMMSLSRYQLEATRDWRLPARPGKLVGQVMAHDEATGRWTLELRGPRLPARFDIVHRYLYVYGRFDPATGHLDQLTVTIRGWVLE